MTPAASPPAPSRWLPLVLWALLLIAACFPAIAGWQSVGRLNDDSYITLTYVKSLVAGDGWRYNGGTLALGTTTPLFALVVAGLARLLPFFSIEQLAVAWSVLCWWFVGGCFAFGHRAWGLARHEGQIIALILLLQGGYWYATLGMEATFLLAGVVGTAWLAARGSLFGTGLAAGLLFLIRPEGLAMVPLAGAWLLWQQRSTWQRVVVRYTLGALLPLGAWSLYAWLTFGAILPNSAAAKLEQGDQWGGITFTQRLFNEWLPPHFRAYGVTSFLSVLIPLGVAGVAVALRRSRPVLLVVAWVALFLAAYTLLEAPPYWWYMLPVLFGIHLLVGAGWGALFALPHRWQRGIVTVLLCAFIGTVATRSAVGLQNLQGDRRAEGYRAVATWLNANTPPNSTVAYIEIGYLGYYGERPIVDLVGLIDPQYRENGATLNVARNFWLVPPDYFVYVADFDWMVGEIVQNPEFSSTYRLATELPSSFNAPLQIYERLPSLAP